MNEWKQRQYRCLYFEQFYAAQLPEGQELCKVVD